MAVTDTLKDAAYVTVGIGVLGFQKAQVRRVELTKQIEAIVAPVRTQLEAQLDTIEAALPTSVADLFKQARAAAHETETAVRKSLGVGA